MLQNDSLLHNIKLKMLNQGNINTLYDDFIIQILMGNLDNELSKNNREYITNMAYEFLCENKIKRFQSWDYRKKYSTSLDQVSYHLSQGSHSVLKWKNFNLFKSCFDLAIYTQLINNIKPDIIIEYGSGDGGSALWMEDMTKSLGLETKIISYDIKNINIKKTKVIFNQIDLTKELPKIKKEKGIKLVIEDAHVNLVKVLLNTDKILNKNDYMVIEDSRPKKEQIGEFLKKSKNIYEVDTFYTDFFGKNYTTAINTIFRVK